MMTCFLIGGYILPKKELHRSLHVGYIVVRAQGLEAPRECLAGVSGTCLETALARRAVRGLQFSTKPRIRGDCYAARILLGVLHPSHAALLPTQFYELYWPWREDPIEVCPCCVFVHLWDARPAP